MRIVFFGNNHPAWQVLSWLHEQREEIAGLVLHPVEKQKYGPELLELAKSMGTPILEGPELRTPQGLETVRSWRPDLGISVSFSYILRPELLSLFPREVINLHTSYLPYNRGAYPNVWSIIDGTPAGVTLHYIDAGVDTGDIIAQREVPVEPWDTGKSLYDKLTAAAVGLFKTEWKEVRAGTAVRHSQPADNGTSHRVRDAESLDLIDLDRSYTARELLDVLRARTFPPYRNAHFVVNGQRVYLHLKIERE